MGSKEEIMFTKPSLATVLVVSMLLAFIGCGEEENAAEKLIGNWEILSVDGEPFVEEEGVILSNEWEFLGNGTWKLSVKGVMAIPGSDVTLIITADGIYTASASTIDVEVKDSSATIPPELEWLVTEEEAKELSAEGMEKITGTGTFMVSGDKLTIIGESGSTIIFNRK